MNRLRSMPLAPSEGWATFALVVLLAFITGWAVDDAAWILGRDPLTDCLPWAAIGGVIAGFVTAKLGWNRVTSALAGAIAAALVVPILIGSIMVPNESDFVVLYQATAKSVADAITDLIILGRGSTTQFGHFQLALALLLWGTGQFAASSVFRHGRAVPAVVALGGVLLLNVALTLHDQYIFLIPFTLTALLLLVRMHALEERRDWLRRRIGDPGTISALTLRAGTVFVTLAILGSLTLTAVASSDPLKDTWRGAQPWLVAVGRRLEPYFGFISNLRGPAVVDFGPTTSIGYQWTSSQDIAAVIAVPPSEQEAFYWRAATYDQFDGYGWSQTDEVRVDRPAGSDVLDQTVDAPTEAGRRAVVFRVTPQDYGGTQVLSPESPQTLDVPSTLSVTGEGGFFDSVAVPSAGESYTVRALVRVQGDADPAALTANKLKVAGTDYPPEVTERYLQLPPGAWDAPAAQQLLRSILAPLPLTDPYDIAKTIEATLKDPTQFSYEPNLTAAGVSCGDLNAAECFATYRKGFCQYFATAMIVMLRTEGIPARLAQGFLPGERAADGTETVRFSNSHAWVEVYFPGYGWVPFDPTGGNVSHLAALPAGRPVAAPSATPRASLDTDPARDPIGRPQTGPGGTGGSTTSGGGPGSAPFIAIALLLAVMVGGLAFAAWRRGPREPTPESAWGSFTTLARRLGWGPQPTQTVYEYAATLGEAMPSVRPELQTVARAKVEVTYGHQMLGADRMLAIREATGRLRVALVRLALRRRRRPRR
jgi:transglutaminase-like putative cysteine protease